MCAIDSNNLASTKIENGWVAENGIPVYNKEIIVCVAFHLSNPPSQGGNVQIIQKKLAV